MGKFEHNRFYRTVENSISIPGISGTHVFLHVSDLHACAIDASSSEEENAHAKMREKTWSRAKIYLAKKFHEPFASAHKISTVECAQKLMSYSNEIKPECLLISGDYLEFSHEAGYRFMKSQFDSCQTPLMFVPGNHEGRIDKNPRLKDFCGDGDVQIFKGDGFIIAGVDDANKSVSDRQLAQIKELSKGSIPVILLMHVPIATSENAESMSVFEDYYYISENTEDKNAREFIDTLKDPDSSICCILAGHTHGYNISSYCENKKQICASSGMIGFIHKFTVKGI